MQTNQDYKTAARARLKGNWSPVVVATIVFILVSLICSSSNLVGSSERGIVPPVGNVLAMSGVCFILGVFVLAPASIGYVNATLLMYQTGNTDLTRNMWTFATDNYLHKMLGYLCMSVKILLWCLLLFIPGIVMSFAYALTPYILHECPELSPWEASTRSREMMKGHKFELFYLYLSFIGWFILSILTCGVGFIWLIPYMQMSVAAFYEDLKSETTIVLG